MKKVRIYGGGTYALLRPHLAVCAPAFGTTAKKLNKLYKKAGAKTKLILTKMADNKSKIYTNDDLSFDIHEILDRHDKPDIIVMTCAVCDFYAPYNPTKIDSSKDINLSLYHTDKIISRIRKDGRNKEIFLIGCKTVANEPEHTAYAKAVTMMKTNSCNLVLLNDIRTYKNYIITPEEYKYEYQTREDALKDLVEMSMNRSNLTFHRTKLTKAPNVKLDEQIVPKTFKSVLDWVIKNNAYKPFNDKTVGHFAFFKDETMFSSMRHHNHNLAFQDGMVKVTFENDVIIVHGMGKPSAGARTQWQLFKDHPNYDCLIHFHCPMKKQSSVNIRPQKPYECGSLECGINTSIGMKPINENIAAVMLSNHGPNILFKSTADPTTIINWINDNFDLTEKTGGIITNV